MSLKRTHKNKAQELHFHHTWMVINKLLEVYVKKKKKSVWEQHEQHEKEIMFQETSICGQFWVWSAKQDFGL